MNDHQADNRNAPSYLSHYGMFRAPFMNTVEDDMYYAEPTRTQRLDILLHLAQYGNELLLVTGPEGSGKTTMLHQFMKKIGEGWKVCQINAHNMLTKEQLLTRISNGFDLPNESGPSDRVTANLKRRLDAMLATHTTVVIAVDNAQALTTDSLNLLLELATIRNISKGIAVRILLFSEPQIKIQLASPELQTRQTLPIRKVDLPPFDEQQTARLIRHRVTTAGLVSKHVFNDAIVSKIYKYSQGWPGLINEIAHQVLFESTPLKRRDNKKQPGNGGAGEARSWRPLTIAVTLVIATGLAALLLFQEQINTLFKGKHSTTVPASTDQHLVIPGQKNPASSGLPSPQATTPAASLAKADRVEEQEFPVINEPGSLPSGTPASTSTNTLISTPTPATTPTTTDTNSAVATPPVSARKAPSERSRSDANIAQKQQTASTSTQESGAVAVSPTIPQHATVPLSHQEEWIMSQNPDDFTLQLVAGYQESTVLNFISTHKLPESELAYYYSLNRGKGWHSLLFGSYPNRDQAMGAATELRKHLKNIKPWIRSFKSVQGDILYARSHSR